MSEILENSKNVADAIVVGGGAVGLHTAHAMHEAMGKNARILAVTQEGEWGGLAGRSLEQFRMFNDSYAMAEIVSKSMEIYDRANADLCKQKKTESTYERFPYIFTVGTQERPEYLAEVLPPGTPDRPDMEYYRKLASDTISWGFDPEADELTPAELRDEYPLLDGDGIEGAMVVNNAGRLHFDIMRSWLMERSRADGDGHGVTYRANTTARKILIGKGGEAIGVDFGGEKIYSDKIILAIGAFAVNLAQLLPGKESEQIASNFTVTQRELFFANMQGVPDNTNFFLISPDMAIARISTREGHASYGYAAMDDLVERSPVIDPRPVNHKDLFVGRTYALLAECSSRWDPDKSTPDKPNLAIEPHNRLSAGYYSAYKDDLPVVGKIGDTGVILAAGSHHSGIMGGQGIAELAVDHALKAAEEKNLSQTTHEQTDITRTPVEHTGLVL